MRDEHRPSPHVAVRVNPLVRAAQALCLGFVTLAHMIVAPFALVLGWSRRTPAARDLGRFAAPLQPAQLPASAPLLPDPLPAHQALGSLDRVVCPDFACIVVEPEFTEPRYAAVFTELQQPGSKLLDLRALETVQLTLFERLADAWNVERATVPRLGIVLGYEHWVAFHALAARRLRPIVRCGIEIEIFYTHQLPDTVPAWFAGERVEHPLPVILAWLRAEWQPGVMWAKVLDTTAMLVAGAGHRELVPDQLLQLAAIALSLRGRSGALEAAKHVESALCWIGDTPSRIRCRALRMLASAMQLLGETEEALAQLNAAICIAALIGDPIEEASALAEIGAYALHRRHFARAEGRFRAALALLSTDDLPYLRASLHHQLASALYEQGKDAKEAEHHAAAALALRWDPNSRLAAADRELLARIRARRRSPTSEHSIAPLIQHRDPRNP